MQAEDTHFVSAVFRWNGPELTTNGCMAVTEMPCGCVLEIVAEVAGADDVAWPTLWRSALEAIGPIKSPRRDKPAEHRPTLPPAVRPAASRSATKRSRQQRAVDHYRANSTLPRLRPRSDTDKSPLPRTRPQWNSDAKLPRPLKHHKRPKRDDASDLLLRDLLDDVSRQKKERLLAMLVKIEHDLAASPPVANNRARHRGSSP